MNARSPEPATPLLGRPIRVGLRLEDPEAEARLAETLGVLDPGLRTLGREETEADVVIADWPVRSDAPLIFLESTRRRRARRAAARAIVDPALDLATLAAVVRLVAAGYSVQPPDAGQLDRIEADPPDEPTLTAREQEVLALLAEGASNKVVARRLGISPSTAKFHVASILEKLGAANRLDAITVGVRRGLLYL